MGDDKRILLVDDDREQREMLALVLEDAGYSVTQAENGDKALQQLRGGKENPSLILLDLLMPVMNGWQFCDAQRADPALADIPVVAISSAAKKDPTSPYYIDVDDVLPKPVAMKELMDVVRRFVQ